MIQKLSSSDLDSILHIINDAAAAYKGVIPEDRWKEPYMSREELKREVDDGVFFTGGLRMSAWLG